MEIIVNSLQELEGAAETILRHVGDKKVWLFDGQMGAGKTTFIRAVCKHLGVKDVTSSPTFSLVNVYEDADGKELYHFDFYRIKDEMEALDIGCEDYFYSDSYCFIEWFEKIPSLIPDNCVIIKIEILDPTIRKFIVSDYDSTP